MDKILERPVTQFAATMVCALALAVWAARAPTSFTGSIGFLGGLLGMRLDAVDLIIFGPAAAATCVGLLWVLIANGPDRVTKRMTLRDRHSESILLGTLLALILVLATALSLQYFLILAPADLCASRPHFDFLWTNARHLERITHCMSGTDAINASSPYYLEPRTVQSWGHVLWPLLTLALLVGAWRAWTRAPTSGRHPSGIVGDPGAPSATAG